MLRFSFVFLTILISTSTPALAVNFLKGLSGIKFKQEISIAVGQKCGNSTVSKSRIMQDFYYGDYQVVGFLNVCRSSAGDTQLVLPKNIEFGIRHAFRQDSLLTSDAEDEALWPQDFPHSSGSESILIFQNYFFSRNIDSDFAPLGQLVLVGRPAVRVSFMAKAFTTAGNSKSVMNHDTTSIDNYSITQIKDIYSDVISIEELKTYVDPN